MAKAIEIKNGNPYFCKECKRNHTKGKIYKEHIEFAKEVKSNNISDNSDMDYDEEELIEAFKELEEKDYDEDDIEDDVDDCVEFSLEDSIKEVKKLAGVGEATLSKLVKAGFTSLESIAFTPPKLIQEESGIGEKSTAKLIKESMEKLNIGFKSASEVWEFRKNIARITTNSPEFDEVLGGGVETGSLIEFFGEFRTGKTQIAHQLCVNVQLPKDRGGLEGNALYIDTEGTFRPERIIQMSHALDLDTKKVLKNIIYGRAYNSDHQILLIKEAGNLIKERNVKLIIVDSLIGHFRSEYIGRGTLANRQQLINTHLHDLLRLIDINPELSIVVTNQVSAKPDTFYGNPLRATGGNIVAHGSTIRVYIRKGKGEQRIAKIVDAPHLPEGEAIFSITEDGITEVK